MEGFESVQFTDKDKRDDYFRELRRSSFSFPNERQAIKYSDVAPLLVEGRTEPFLDSKGRQRYCSVFIVAYPKEIHGHRVRARVKRQEARDARNKG